MELVFHLEIVTLLLRYLFENFIEVQHMQMYHLPDGTRLGLYQYLLCEIIIIFSFLVFSLSKLWHLSY